MERLRIPFFIVAVFLIAIVFCLEAGSPFLRRLPGFDRLFAASTSSIESVIRQQLVGQGLSAAEVNAVVAEAMASSESPPGMGIPTLALLDGILLFTVGLIGLGVLAPEHIHAKYQGVATLIFSLHILTLSAIAIAMSMVLLFVMLTLLLAFPFGTIFYLIKYGSFPTGQSAAILAMASTLRVAFIACMLLAHQRFIQNKGLILILLTAFLGSVVVSFLQGFPPSILASITDAIAAIVVGVLALVWAIILIVGSLVSMVKLIP